MTFVLENVKVKNFSMLSAEFLSVIRLVPRTNTVVSTNIRAFDPCNGYAVLYRTQGLTFKTIFVSPSSYKPFINSQIFCMSFPGSGPHGLQTVN